MRNSLRGRLHGHRLLLQVRLAILIHSLDQYKMLRRRLPIWRSSVGGPIDWAVRLLGQWLSERLVHSDLGWAITSSAVSQHLLLLINQQLLVGQVLLV